MYKKAWFLLILIGCMMVSGCKKKQTINTIEDVTKLSPTVVTIPTISNTPTVKPTNVVTVTPTLSPASILEQEKMYLLSFEVQPITVPEDFETPYMTKEEFPVLDGSTANIPLGEAIYCHLTGATEEDAKKDLKFNKTTNSYERLMYGDSDILFVYEPSQTVLEEMKQRYAEFEFKPLGRDALVFIANESNTISSLTQQEIFNIYTGKTKNWSELGGSNQEIIAFQRPETSGSQTLMEKLAVPASDLMIGPQVIRPAEMEGLIKTIASYNNESNALGYSVYYYANYMYTKPGLKFMAIDGVLPTNETIQKGEYPYVNDFYVVIRKEEPVDSKARILYNYMTTKEAQTILTQAGYVPVVDVKATYPALKKVVEIQGELKLKQGQYLVDHNVTSDVFEGDRILTSDYRPIASFTSKYIECGNNLVIDSDVILLKSYQTVTNGYTRFVYELYSISQQKYITEHPYEDVHQTKEGFYYFISYNDQSSEREEVYYSPSGTLICRLITKDSEHEFLEVVKDRVVHVKDDTLTYFDNKGKIIKQTKMPYDNVTKANISNQWKYTNEDYLWLRVQDTYLIIYDKDGNPIDDQRFTKNLDLKPQIGKPWITDSIVGTDGHLYVVGKLERNLCLLRDDGKVLFERDTTYETYRIVLYGHVFYINDQTKNLTYYMSLEGDLLNPDGNELQRTNDAVILARKGEFTVYPTQISDVYIVKDKLYDITSLYGSEGETNPYLTHYNLIPDQNGDWFRKANFYGLRSFDDYASVRKVGEYFILRCYSSDGKSHFSELLDLKGNTIFKSKVNETITDVIVGEEIYVAVNSGNYEEIQDLQGKYLYREISSYLADD